MDAYQAAGVAKVMWVCADDEMTCDECSDADGETVLLEQDFPDVDVSEPPAHPLVPLHNRFGRQCGIVGIDSQLFECAMELIARRLGTCFILAGDAERRRCEIEAIEIGLSLIERSARHDPHEYAETLEFSGDAFRAVDEDCFFGNELCHGSVDLAASRIPDIQNCCSPEAPSCWVSYAGDSI